MAFNSLQDRICLQNSLGGGGANSFSAIRLESENITNLLEVSQSAIRSNAKSIAFAYAVKIEDPSEICIVSEKSSDTTAHPTFISSLEPSV